LSGGTIPPGSGILTQVTYSGFEELYICFGEDTGGAGTTAISDGGGGYLAADWGECACPAGLDECGECGGSGISEDACDCFGNMEDECGTCGGDNSTCADCAGIPNGDNIEDNCGTCDDDSLNDCNMDCDGEWGGNAIKDECGVCGGPGLGGGTYYMDCWDGEEYCINSDCPIDPTGVSYRIYRRGLGIPINSVANSSRIDRTITINAIFLTIPTIHIICTTPKTRTSTYTTFIFYCIATPLTITIHITII
jgi:hypothetical protein